MNIVFIGASHFGLRCLELANSLENVVVTGVVTAPAVFSISYRPTGVTNVLHADITAFAKAHDLPVVLMQQSMKEMGLLEIVRSWRPDAFLVAGWYHMIPKSWREIAPAYGLHASLLPNYSGGAPLVWAMINGEKRTGITLFQMDDGVDSGLIAGQSEEPIYDNDTIATLYARIEDRGLDLLKWALPALAGGTLTLVSQDETKRHIHRQRSPEDGIIDWSQDSVVIERFIRAQTRPYPGAFTTLDGEKLTIWAAINEASETQGRPGQVYFNGTGYGVYCGRGRLRLKEATYSNRNLLETELADVFGAGGQYLGAGPSRMS